MHTPKSPKMEPPQQISSTTAAHLRHATEFLSLRDYNNCRRHALLAQHSDQTNPTIPQILAIADVLTAAENGSHDWSSILQLPQNHIDPNNSKLVREQLDKLINLVNPSVNEFPLAKEAFGYVGDAWNEFLDTEVKIKLKNDEQVLESEGNGHARFWTVCPYCYYAYEYDKLYEGCCLRCQNCMFSFHGLAVDISDMVKGNDEYCCSFGVFPLGYSKGVVKGSGRRSVEVCDDGGKMDCEVSDRYEGFESWLRGDGVVGNIVSERNVVKDGGGDVGNVEFEKDVVKDSGDFGVAETGRVFIKGGGDVRNVEYVVKDGDNVEPEVEIGKDGEDGNLMPRNKEISGGNVFARPMRNVKAVVRNSKKKAGRGVRIKMSDL